VARDAVPPGLPDDLVVIRSLRELLAMV
jgi:hypothetical protein